MIFEKIGPHHLERKAILYVRQSSPHQVLHNRESSTLQYAMRDRLGPSALLGHRFTVGLIIPPCPAHFGEPYLRSFSTPSSRHSQE